MNEITLTILLPDISGVMPRVALETLLSRARSHTVLPVERMTALLSLFGATLPPDADIPVAPVTWNLDHGEPAAGYVLRADPVHLVADRDVLRLLHHENFPVAAAEAQGLVAALNTHFATDGLRFSAPHPQRWYLSIPESLKMRTHAPDAAAGAPLESFLPWGENGALWHRHLNEIQMLLHSHPVNEAREARGQPVINSVWLWGGGVTPTPARNTWAQVWSEEPLALGLAKLSATPRTALPPDAQSWLDAAITPGDHLLVLPHTFTEEFTMHLDTRWFAPLLAALKTARLQQLTLCSAGHRWSIDRTAAKRWWVRRRALSAFIDLAPSPSGRGLG